MNQGIVIADLLRNPWFAWHWIPGAVTPDLIWGRDDKSGGAAHGEALIIWSLRGA